MVLRGYFGMFTFFIFYAFKNGDGFFFNSRLNIRQDILDISIITTYTRFITKFWEVYLTVN